MNSIQISYYFAKENPAVIDFVHGEESDNESDDENDESYNEEEEEVSGMESSEDRNDDNNNGGEEVNVSPQGALVTRLTTKPVSDLASMTLYPCQLVEKYREDKEKMENDIELLNHMTTFVTREHWDKTKVHTRTYLGVAASAEQKRLFNPMHIDCIDGYIIS
eukprot:12935824-Ditylum_brightwellii.AAC.1